MLPPHSRLAAAAPLRIPGIALGRRLTRREPTCGGGQQIAKRNHDRPIFPNPPYPVDVPHAAKQRVCLTQHQSGARTTDDLRIVQATTRSLARAGQWHERVQFVNPAANLTTDI